MIVWILFQKRELLTFSSLLACFHQTLEKWLVSHASRLILDYKILQNNVTMKRALLGKVVMNPLIPTKVLKNHNCCRKPILLVLLQRL